MWRPAMSLLLPHSTQSCDSLVLKNEMRFLGPSKIPALWNSQSLVFWVELKNLFLSGIITNSGVVSPTPAPHQPWNWAPFLDFM